ncbi:NAD(P)-dependent alcohol dehydrogenase [Ktedonosporobacter rubrisoli]|uniref:NAD(P)-dependent alcohol dehydrogenase n=1 Tax=Ktedonosporobacter rubrisoli TaxID=2509675 RepID=A0A4P6JZW8_KTERU|nr:NAD(P)-dependent alcohol dehydrogenase [Ktedonosporobacter rubrisoli]QBD81052.1 NAD(P)-dependent alcohol dehydrogenase [Ktedonosporobacter rubrisoli]
MYTWQLIDVQGTGQLQRIEQEQPQPGPGEVLVKMRAASLNHRDLYILEEMGTLKIAEPVIPLSDGAGEVAVCGEGSRRFQVGDRVVLPCFPHWLEGRPRQEVLPARGEPGTPGVLTDYLVAREEELLALPAYLTYAEGATLPVAGLTAWNALVSGRLQAGETVLIQGTGGVSVFGIQLAKASGARVIVTSRHDEKLARARELDADETINTTKTQHWDEEVQKLTAGRGADHILEVGGAETIARSLRSVSLGGYICLIGGLGGFSGPVEFSELRDRLAIVQTIYAGSRAVFAQLNDFIAQHKIHPIIDRSFPVEQAKEAFAYLAEGKHFGKVVITWPQA